MTTPAQPPTQPTPVAAQPVATTHAHPVSLRAVISVVETVAFVAATVLTTMNNGTDFRHAFIAAFVGFIAHGVNHNAGGSPV